jgi:hypothetical protein
MALRRPIDEVLDDHGFVARSCPHERCSQARNVGDALHDVRALDGINNGVGQRRERVIRRSQQDAAQPDNIAGDRNDRPQVIGRSAHSPTPHHGTLRSLADRRNHAQDVGR